MDANELKAILDRHVMWLCEEKDGKRADLSGACLNELDLSGVNLSGAYLHAALLREVNLNGATLRRADLSGSNLCGAYLNDADLRHANLCKTYLNNADLARAYLNFADLRGADLRDANLYGADLRGADLSKADLRRANPNAVIADYMTSGYWPVSPETGEFIAYKHCEGDAIVTLRVPAKARRSSSTTRKCRAEFVEVLKIESKKGSELDVAYASYDGTEYRVGETVRCHKWDEDRWVECGGGIHFFMSRDEAVAWGIR